MSLRRPFRLIALLLIVGGLRTVAAQSTSWALMPVGSPHTSLAHLSPEDRALATRLLRPELGPLFQGESPKVADDAIRSFLAEHIRLGNISAIVLQSTGSDLCSLTGNCALWIIDVTLRRVILRPGPVRGFTIARGTTRGVPDIFTSMHGSATETDRTLWSFNGNRYEAKACARVDFADADGKPYSQPKVTPQPCSPEDN
ncbi:MAG TPA: hypothetical protein VGM11_09500 [Acidobacteriaceae bacterium]